MVAASILVGIRVVSCWFVFPAQTGTAALLVIVPGFALVIGAALFGAVVVRTRARTPAGADRPLWPLPVAGAVLILGVGPVVRLVLHPDDPNVLHPVTGFAVAGPYQVEAYLATLLYGLWVVGFVLGGGAIVVARMRASRRRREAAPRR